ncbi:MAG: hypothetical protein ABIQ35_02280 [Verrucomicrobiota bacterium]
MNAKLLSRFRFVVASLVLSTALLFTSCATQRQVKDIVSASNLAALSTELNLGAEDPGKPGGQGETWKQASAKIDAFIAQHPENKPTVAALRVRQAMLLLNNKQYNLAHAAFDEAKLEDLRGSSRDRALKRLDADLLWWYPTAGGTLPREEFSSASKSLERISAVWKELKSPEDEGVRDWLAALRAWIGLKMANDADADAVGTNVVRGFLEGAINTYSSMLPVNEAAQWQSMPDFPPAGMTMEIAVNGPNRRRFRADDLIAAARKVMANNRIATPEITEPYFREKILR